MSDTIHNWNIEAMRQMGIQLKQAHDMLTEEKSIMSGISFELPEHFKGKAGEKFLNVTIEDAAELDVIIQEYEQLMQKLELLINTCYSPCENDIRQKVNALLV